MEGAVKSLIESVDTASRHSRTGLEEDHYLPALCGHLARHLDFHFFPFPAPFLCDAPCSVLSSHLMPCSWEWWSTLSAV